MRRTRRTPKTSDERKQIARITKQWLVGSITLLAALALILIFRVGQVLWPVWMIDHRTLIIGIVVLILVVVILVSPLIIEASSNTRTLSGPGKNPKGPNLP
jgi:membrane protein DedA with SNARE-associated domain